IVLDAQVQRRLKQRVVTEAVIEEQPDRKEREREKAEEPRREKRQAPADLLQFASTHRRARMSCRAKNRSTAACARFCASLSAWSGVASSRQILSIATSSSVRTSGQTGIGGTGRALGLAASSSKTSM